MVFFEFLRRIGYCEAVREHLPFSFRSPNAIDPVKTFTAFLLSVVEGARRFAHTSLLRADTALHALLGISRFPCSQKTRRGPNPPEESRFLFLINVSVSAAFS